jgi:hypothetical protein
MGVPGRRAGVVPLAKAGRASAKSRKEASSGHEMGQGKRKATSRRGLSTPMKRVVGPRRQRGSRATMS